MSQGVTSPHDLSHDRHRRVPRGRDHGTTNGVIGETNTTAIATYSDAASVVSTARVVAVAVLLLVNGRNIAVAAVFDFNPIAVTVTIGKLWLGRQLIIAPPVSIVSQLLVVASTPAAVVVVAAMGLRKECSCDVIERDCPHRNDLTSRT